jgi:phosphoribosylglycinamide formyltransferase 1
MEAVIKNFQKGSIPGVSEISFVLSDKKSAPGIEKAQKLGIHTIVLPKMKEESREEYEIRLFEAVRPFDTGLIVLAGFMKIIGTAFLSRYSGKIINIHPSLLPSFKGVDAQTQAFDYGVKVSGCTIHFVDETLDGGPIILQKAVERYDSDTADDLKHRILEQEHRLLSEAVSIIAQEKYTIKGRLVLLERR